MPERATESREPTPLTLADYFGWLRRRWWILALSSVVGLAAAAGFTTTQTPTYTSKTVLTVQPVGVDASPSSKVNLDTEAQVIRSTVVAERAADLMTERDLTADQLIAGVTVTVPPNSQVFQVSFSANRPKVAQDGSQSISQAYLDLRADNARRGLDAEVTGLKSQIATAEAGLDDIAKRIAGAPVNSPDRARADAQRTVLTQQLSNLNNSLSPLLTARLVPGAIISNANLPRKPSAPDMQFNAVTGFAAGLLAGVGLALLLDRLDTRVRRSRDLSRRLGLDVLLDVSYKIPETGLLPVDHRLAHDLGRLRNLLVTLVPTARGRRGRVVLVVGATPGATAGFVAGNLAAAHARAGARVAAFSTNELCPLPELVAAAGEPAATGRPADPPRGDRSAVWRSPLNLASALTPASAVPQLQLLRASDLNVPDLTLECLLGIIDELAARFDHVVVLTPPPAAALEVQALSRHVDSVLLVVEKRSTRNHDVTDALEQFDQVAAPLVGAVCMPYRPATRRRPWSRATAPDTTATPEAVTAPDAAARPQARPSEPADIDSTTTVLQHTGNGRPAGTPVAVNSMTTPVVRVRPTPTARVDSATVILQRDNRPANGRPEDDGRSELAPAVTRGPSTNGSAERPPTPGGRAPQQGAS